MFPPIIIDLIYPSIFLLDDKTKEKNPTLTYKRESKRRRRRRREKKRNASILKSLLSYAVREYE